ncbi:MAG TPA: phosphatase PAP2 family protein [Longimicrobium sp.]|nr:phosphatase PAP2 family protein [Longimicrobium sp.]
MTTWIIRLHHHDERALHALVLRRHPRLDRAMHLVTHLGDAAVTIGVTLALLLGAVPTLRDAGVRAAFALVASHAVVQLLKRTVTRARPRMPEGFAALVQPPDRFSFPSGHAASSLSVAVAVAAVLAPSASAALVALALVVGLSRCYLGVHYPGDVIAGWTLALLGILAAGPALSLLG